MSLLYPKLLANPFPSCYQAIITRGKGGGGGGGGGGAGPPSPLGTPMFLKWSGQAGISDLNDYEALYSNCVRSL